MKKAALFFLKSKKSLNNPRRSSNFAGQSIVEIVLALGVASLVIGALVILGSASLRTALSSARRTEATRLAETGLEAMRFLRDVQGFSQLEVGCYQIDPATSAVTKMTAGAGLEFNCTTEPYGWQSINLSASSSQGIFERRIKVEEYGNNASEKLVMRKVTVQVKWAEGAGASIGGDSNQRDVEMSVVLSQWK